MAALSCKTTENHWQQRGNELSWEQGYIQGLCNWANDQLESRCRETTWRESCWVV